MSFVDLYFNCMGSCTVSWGLCYNSIIGNAILISFTISYEIVFITLEIFCCDSYISIHIICLALRNPCRSVGFGNEFGHDDIQIGDSSMTCC